MEYLYISSGEMTNHFWWNNSISAVKKGASSHQNKGEKRVVKRQALGIDCLARKGWYSYLPRVTRIRNAPLTIKGDGSQSV